MAHVMSLILIAYIVLGLISLVDELHVASRIFGSVI